MHQEEHVVRQLVLHLHLKRETVSVSEENKTSSSSSGVLGYIINRFLLKLQSIKCGAEKI